jgi:hypothetical protein
MVAAVVEPAETAPIRKTTALNHHFPSKAALSSLLILIIVYGDFFAKTLVNVNAGI